MKKLNYKNIGLALIMLNLVMINILILKNITVFYNHIGLTIFMFSGTLAYIIGLYFKNYLKERGE